MLGAIPNPKKVIVIERPIGRIKELLPLIPLINTKYKKTTFDDILNLDHPLFMPKIKCLESNYSYTFFHSPESSSNKL